MTAVTRLTIGSIVRLSLTFALLQFFLIADEDSEIAISPVLEKALDKHIEKIVSSQASDGSWPEKGKNVGVCALNIMALMSMGNLPGEGKYGNAVAKGLDFVVKQAKPNGVIESAPGFTMYGHGLATLMLSEAWGQTRRKDIGVVLRRAIDLIVRVQGPKGTWNYNSINKDGDTSVSVMQMFALKSAHEAGVFIPEGTIEKALRAIMGRYDKEGPGFGYHKKFTLTHLGSSAAGTTIMQICKVKDLKYTVECFERLYKELRDNKKIYHEDYFLYYGSVCAYNLGGKHYAKWQKLLEPKLIKKFEEEGGATSGRAFLTLAGALPFRYIPIYQN